RTAAGGCGQPDETEKRSAATEAAGHAPTVRDVPERGLRVGLQLGGRLGAAVVEALSVLDAQLLYDRVLARALDALRDESRAERRAEADDRVQQRLARFVLVDRGGEAAVDLHDVDRQPLQVDE